LHISLISWFGVIRVLFCISGVLIAEEVGGVGDKVSGDTATLVYRHALKPF
jgi:hypothetical protein